MNNMMLLVVVRIIQQQQQQQQHSSSSLTGRTSSKSMMHSTRIMVNVHEQVGTTVDFGAIRLVPF